MAVKCWEQNTETTPNNKAKRTKTINRERERERVCVCAAFYFVEKTSQNKNSCQKKKLPMPVDAEDLTLPRATVQKIISEILEPEYTFSKEARDIVIRSGIEFIMILSSMSSDIAENESKKTIAPEHVIKALEELEYFEFLPSLNRILVEYKGSQKVKEKKDSKFKKSGLSEEELLRQQEELFRQSRSRLHQNSITGMNMEQ